MFCSLTRLHEQWVKSIAKVTTHSVWLQKNRTGCHFCRLPLFLFVRILLPLCNNEGCLPPLWWCAPLRPVEGFFVIYFLYLLSIWLVDLKFYHLVKQHFSVDRLNTSHDDHVVELSGSSFTPNSQGIEVFLFTA
jgi:hypothetical protein